MEKEEQRKRKSPLEILGLCCERRVIECIYGCLLCATVLRLHDACNNVE